MPDQLNRLAFWYRAGDPLNTVTSGAVQQAFDLSGNGRDATASGGGIMVAGRVGAGFGGSQFFELGSQLTANRAALVGKTAQGAQPARITATERIDPTDTNYAVFRIDDASAGVRDLQGVVTDTSNLVAVAAGSATLQDPIAEVGACYGGSFGTPAAILLGARYSGGHFTHAETHVLATVGVSNALAAVDQLKLIDWATAKWGV